MMYNKLLQALEESSVNAKENKDKIEPITKTKNSYTFKDKTGKVLSSVKYFDYSKKDFDWILLADIETKPEYREKGFASKLINAIYNDIAKDGKNGLYLFVKVDNHNAIKLYKKLGFNIVKKYLLNDTNYYIMAKGNADQSQFNNMKFS